MRSSVFICEFQHANNYWLRQPADLGRDDDEREEDTNIHEINNSAERMSQEHSGDCWPPGWPEMNDGL
jgi:hypothetical protein